MTKIFGLLLAGTLLALAAVVFAAADGVNQGPAAAQRAVFKVENLTCGACLSNINSGLSPLAGFAGIGANLFRGLVAVDFTPPLTPEKIKESISALGYPAALSSVEPVTEKESFAFMQSRQRGGKGGCCGGAPLSVSQGQCPGNRGGCALPANEI